MPFAIATWFSPTKKADPRGPAFACRGIETAISRGVFGAPAFVTADGELFWGDDRLEQALGWAVDKPRI